MSNPDGYHCCGQPMHVIELSDIYDGACAFICPMCGIWRHRFSPGDDRRRKVEAAMPAMVDALLVGSRGDVA
jgi:hypothetical protein